jgi:hypothetical protein
MHVTLLGLLILPVCLLCAFSPALLLQLVLALGVVDAASIVSVGQIGLNPALLPTLLFTAYMVLQLLLGARFDSAQTTLRLTWPWLAVAAWGVAGSVMLPQLFAGDVMVHPQKLPLLVPLQPDGSNRNQVIYLIANSAILLLCALYTSRRTFSARSLVNTFLATGFAVGFICWWQLASKLAGVPFPDDFFHSNPGYAQLSEQAIGNVPRINGPFTEPAAVGGYMASIFGATLWMMLQGHRGLWLRLLCLLAFLTMLISTSTTGIAALAVMIAGLPIYVVWRRSARLIAMFSVVGLAVALIVAAALSVGPVLFPATSSAVQQVTEATLQKQQSSSYEDRTQTDLDSLATLVPTGGLGVGWGSNRSSSLLPGLLANLGVYGTLGVIAFGWRLALAVGRARRVTGNADDRRTLDAAIGCLGGGLIATLLSGPTITAPGFFVMLALLIGTAARVRTNAPKRARRAVQMV